ncbi:MAG: periplasmic heavy metal sensor [Alphaproteobacteria bacterium]|nr:periplasmic heavy metal sensor [Alphaproteobacteria bacterium]
MTKWIQGGFIASLVLNVFALGFILSGPFMHDGPPRDPSRRLYEAAQNLSPESREKVMEILDKRTEEIDAVMEDRPEGFRKLSKILTAENISYDDLDKSFQDMAAHHEKVSAVLSQMCTELAHALPNKEERIAFFKEAIPPEPPFFRHRKKKSDSRDR